MLIIAGWLRVDPDARTDYLDGCAAVVTQARTAAGCLDFALTADLLDPGRKRLRALGIRRAAARLPRQRAGHRADRADPGRRRAEVPHLGGGSGLKRTAAHVWLGA
jgi:hypothetical protein